MGFEVSPLWRFLYFMGWVSGHPLFQPGDVTKMETSALTSSNSRLYEHSSSPGGQRSVSSSSSLATYSRKSPFAGYEKVPSNKCTQQSPPACSVEDSDYICRRYSQHSARCWQPASDIHHL